MCDGTASDCAALLSQLCNGILFTYPTTDPASGSVCDCCYFRFEFRGIDRNDARDQASRTHDLESIGGLSGTN